MTAPWSPRHGMSVLWRGRRRCLVHLAVPHTAWRWQQLCARCGKERPR